jgi:hypothetical protein
MDIISVSVRTIATLNRQAGTGVADLYNSSKIHINMIDVVVNDPVYGRVTC